MYNKTAELKQFLHFKFGLWIQKVYMYIVTMQQPALFTENLPDKFCEWRRGGSVSGVLPAGNSKAGHRDVPLRAHRASRPRHLQPRRWVTASNVIYSSEVLLVKRAVLCKITTHVWIARYILRACTCKNTNWQSNNNGQRHSNERVPKIGYAVHFVKHRSAVKIVGTAKRVIVPQLPAVPLKLLSDTCTPMPSGIVW